MLATRHTRVQSECSYLHITPQRSLMMISAFIHTYVRMSLAICHDDDEVDTICALLVSLPP
jgi:hypothetical protein